MTLRKINGKRESPIIKKKNAEKKVEQLKYFVSHMRTLENSISSIKTMAVRLEWDELNLRLISCHKHILDTLAFVKKATKDNNQDIQNVTKPQQKKNHLRIVEDKK